MVALDMFSPTALPSPNARSVYNSIAASHLSQEKTICQQNIFRKFRFVDFRVEFLENWICNGDTFSFESFALVIQKLNRSTFKLAHKFDFKYQ